ncbi:MAG: glycosyltransferase, partial [Limisphaerales bacterium]
LEFCADQGLSYASLVQANLEFIWPNDSQAERLIRVYQKARRAFFVSRGNLRLLETQLGTDLPNSEIVRNPFNLNCTVPVAWPIDDGPLKLACVGRLDPRAKGQDLVFGILASEFWRKRDISLSLFGSGEMEMGLRRLADRLRLSGRVQFCGHVDDVREIWANHHALILPSRFEGLPLAIVEAMLCGRPAIVTDVGGNAELVSEGMNGFIAEAATERHLGEAMERAWQKRADWKTMGMTAAAAIRRCIPLDPAAEFARKLINLAA